MIFERHMPKNNNTCCAWSSDIWKLLISAFQDKRSESEKESKKEFSCFMILWFFVRVFAFIFLLLWVVLGAITAGLLWPPQVRKWLWESFKDDDSQKRDIQEIRRIVTLKEKNLPLESKLNSIILQIKNDIKSKNDQMMKEMNDNKSKNEQMIREMNDKVDAILGFIQQLSKEKQTEGSISGDNNTCSLNVPQTASIY